MERNVVGMLREIKLHYMLVAGFILSMYSLTVVAAEESAPYVNRTTTEIVVGLAVLWVVREFVGYLKERDRLKFDLSNCNNNSSDTGGHRDSYPKLCSIDDITKVIKATQDEQIHLREAREISNKAKHTEENISQSLEDIKTLLRTLINKTS